MKYALEAFIGLAVAIAIAAAGASGTALIIGGLGGGLLIVAVEVLAWRRSQAPPTTTRSPRQKRRYRRWCVAGAIFFALCGVTQLALHAATWVVIVSFGLAVLCLSQLALFAWIERLTASQTQREARGS